MAFRAKTYPYPVLARFTDDYLSGFAFDPSVEIAVTDDKKLLVTANWDDNAMPPSLRDRILDKQALVVANIECAATFRRWVSHLDSERSCFVGIDEVLGDLDITILVLNNSSELFLPKVNDEISSDFAGASKFAVQKGDPLAISDGWQFNLEFEGKRGNDLLRLQFVSERHDDSYTVRLDEEQIVIVAGEHLKKALSIMWSDSVLKPTFAMSLAKDAILAGILDLATKISNGEELSYAWQRGLLSRIQDLGKEVENLSDFQNANTVAQLLVKQSGIDRLVKNVN